LLPCFKGFLLLACALVSGVRYDLAFDASGNIYFPEGSTYNRGTKIRKINTSTGLLSTVGGTGTQGSTGVEGSLATLANIDVSGEIDVDASGNIYFIQRTEGVDSKIRRIKPNGNIETFRTAGSNREFEQVLAAPDGSVYFTERDIENESDNPVYKITKVNADSSVVYIGNGTEGNSGDGASAALAKLAMIWHAMAQRGRFSRGNFRRWWPRWKRPTGC
jgi:hypothetical protein